MITSKPQVRRCGVVDCGLTRVARTNTFILIQIQLSRMKTGWCASANTYDDPRTIGEQVEKRSSNDADMCYFEICMNEMRCRCQ